MDTMADENVRTLPLRSATNTGTRFQARSIRSLAGSSTRPLIKAIPASGWSRDTRSRMSSPSVLHVRGRRPHQGKCQPCDCAQSIVGAIRWNQLFGPPIRYLWRTPRATPAAFDIVAPMNHFMEDSPLHSAAGSTVGRGAASPPIAAWWLGRTAYRDAWDLQHRLVAARYAGRIGDQLLLLEHGPVLTLGRHSDPSHVLATPADLAGRGIEGIETERGGEVTYHGPGPVSYTH